MIVSGLDKLSALYNCFLTIICNVSPYCKCLGTVAAVKIVNLFQLFMSPRFLYATESNSVYVALILETLNNIVQYQYEGNVNIVYAIIRRSVDDKYTSTPPILPSPPLSSPVRSYQSRVPYYSPLINPLHLPILPFPYIATSPNVLLPATTPTPTPPSVPLLTVVGRSYSRPWPP